MHLPSRSHPMFVLRRLGSFPSTNTSLKEWAAVMSPRLAAVGCWPSVHAPFSSSLSWKPFFFRGHVYSDIALPQDVPCHPKARKAGNEWMAQASRRGLLLLLTTSRSPESHPHTVLKRPLYLFQSHAPAPRPPMLLSSFIASKPWGRGKWVLGLRGWGRRQWKKKGGDALLLVYVGEEAWTRLSPHLLLHHHPLLLYLFFTVNPRGPTPAANCGCTDVMRSGPARRGTRRTPSRT